MSANHMLNNNERALMSAFVLTTSFLVIEIIGGVFAGSLALLSDAAHMFTDATALILALGAIWIGKHPVDSQRTFGYYRFEILSALFNATLLFVTAFYILFEAYQRFKTPHEIQSKTMLVIAISGLGINLLSMFLLHDGKDSNLNIKAAYLDVLGDMLGSIGVIVGSLIIYWKDWLWIDPLIGAGIGLWILPRTWGVIKESINILLEGVPEGIELTAVSQAINQVKGVKEVHDLHIWSISSGRINSIMHVVCEEPINVKSFEIIQLINELLAKKFNIHHSTIQLEIITCKLSKKDNHQSCISQDKPS